MTEAVVSTVVCTDVSLTLHTVITRNTAEKYKINHVPGADADEGLDPQIPPFFTIERASMPPRDSHLSMNPSPTGKHRHV